MNLLRSLFVIFLLIFTILKTEITLSTSCFFIFKNFFNHFHNSSFYKSIFNNLNQKCTKMHPAQSQQMTTTNMQQDKPRIPNAVNKYTAISSMLLIFLTSLATYLHYSRRDQPFKPYVDTSSFYPQQNPKLYAGEVHYSRIPVEYWEHRILMIKAMGLNSLSVYIMWNYHQIQKGKFDFQTGNKNLPLFLQLAQKHEMKVFIRPGPYVCAEWDFGGLPGRLLADPGLQIRSINKNFMDEVKIYFAAVAPIIKQHIWTPETPQKCIIMLQIQNQYGFYGADIDYIMELRKIWRSLNVITAEYYVDWFINIRKSHWQGANIGLNDAFTQFQIDYIKTTLEPKGMVFGGEIYSGWLTWWHTPKFEFRDPYEKVKQFQFLMSHNLSYSMYMVHGGTSFGLTAGANARYTDEEGYSGQVTSYDYDAPINEQGASTKKYQVFRESIKKYASWQVPQPPEQIPMTRLFPFKPTVKASVFQNIEWQKPVKTAQKPYVFETQQLKMFNLGIVFYQFKVKSKFRESFKVQIHDLAFIYIDREFHLLLDRTIKKLPTIEIQCKSQTDCEILIMVEAMGHVNYDLSMQEDKKGIVSWVCVTNPALTIDWKMYTLPLHKTDFFDWEKAGTNNINKPVLLRKNFTIENPADTYLNMKKYTKGYIWVNGNNLGRFWNVGPQYKLFCPGVWLNKGNNEVYILELKFAGEADIRGELTLQEDQGNF